MKISIITPTYNSENTLNDTIQSIYLQQHQDIDLEYIIIDGASTDQTKEIISDYQQRMEIRFISEPDNGIYDAMNKGIKMATGDIIGILNSDDFYCSNDTLRKVAAAFSQHPEVDAIYGDLVYVDRENTKKVIRYWKSGMCTHRKLRSGWIIPHPTFFMKREIYKKTGAMFNTSLTIAADYELLLRLLMKYGLKTYYIPEKLVIMRVGGTSGRSLSNRIRGWKEMRQAWKINDLRTPIFFITRRVLSKILQFFVRK